MSEQGEYWRKLDEMTKIEMAKNGKNYIEGLRKKHIQDCIDTEMGIVENPHSQKFKMVGTCENCRFWGEDFDSRLIKSMPCSMGKCARATMGMKPSSMDYILADVLTVYKDFGCIHWEEK